MFIKIHDDNSFDEIHPAPGMSQEQLAGVLAAKNITAMPFKPTRLPYQHGWVRPAWRFNGSDVVVDMTVAKTVAHDLRRARREQLLEPLDRLATSPVAAIKNKAMDDKQAILDADAPVQAAIDAATTPEQIKAAIVAVYGDI